jgi:hypothetical protein
MRCSLHFVDFAFAIENVARFSGAFAFAPVWLVAAAEDVGANLAAADNLLLGRSGRFLLIFCHYHDSLVHFEATADRTYIHRRLFWPSWEASWYAAATKPEVAARNAARSAQAGVASNPLLGTEDAELLAQAVLLRDIFGNPFPPITLDSAWLTPNVVQLADSIYNDRAFDRMPELADALDDAGCDNDELLSHLRGPGPHVRGCWVVDLVLGKK